MLLLLLLLLCVRYAIMSWLPTYFHHVGMSEQLAAQLCAIPFVVQFVFTLLLGSFADSFMRAQFVSPLMVCHWPRLASTQLDSSDSLLFSALSGSAHLHGAGACAARHLLLLPAVQRVHTGQACQVFCALEPFHFSSFLCPAGALIWVSLAFAFDSFNVGGFLVNDMDIAPLYAGSIKGWCNTLGCLAGILSNIVTGYVALTGYAVAFYVIAAFSLVGALFFVIFAQADYIDLSS